MSSMTREFNSSNPCLPSLMCDRMGALLVPIYPPYHTELLPDSILNTESPADFIEQEPHRNAIRKVYVSRSHFKDLTQRYHRVFTDRWILQVGRYDIRNC